MTEKGRGYDGVCAELLCRTQRDARDERGYGGKGREYDGKGAGVTEARRGYGGPLKCEHTLAVVNTEV